MEAAGTIAPPVVAVMVVRQPGEWFDDALDALAGQDYSNLKTLFLMLDGDAELAARIGRRVPNAFVRGVEGTPSFSGAANEVLRLVEGENGFFCFLHDDVALEPSAIRLLVEELYRSNAGIVGPKLVIWDDPTVLQHVGLAVDRFGEVDPIIEPGEVDQEQHDAVRDVFAVPTACLLVRADLFRTIGGFDPAIASRGDEVDLCWRAHLSGARVVVVPAAVGRHLEAMAERSPELVLPGPAARSRMRTVATLTGARRLPLVLLQLVLLSVAQAAYLLVRGRVREAGGLLAALVGIVPAAPSYVRRRRQVAPLRHVPDAEVAGLQLRGSARITASVRARDSRPIDPELGNERRWRESAGGAPVIAWLSVLILFVVGSRRLIADGVPQFGEFLRFPDSPARLFGDYLSGWSGHGLGSTSPVPTAFGLISLASVATLFHMGALHTVMVLGTLLLGYLGAWRLGIIFEAARARVVLLVVYAALPLGVQLASAGRWSALVCYALAPWVVHLVRRTAGVDTRWVDREPDFDTVLAVPARKQRRLMAQLVIAAGVSFAFAPSSVVLVIGIGIALFVATVVAGGAWRNALAQLLVALTGALGAVVVNLPWSLSLVGTGGWTAVVGVRPSGATALGLGALLRMQVGSLQFGVLGVALFLPVLGALVVARSWRFAWAARASAFVVLFGALAVLDDRGALPFRLPDASVLLVPVALGMALSAACVVAAFDRDVMSGTFGLRQPLGVLSLVAAGVGIVPGVLSVADGRWNMPVRTLQTVTTEFPADPPTGDYRTLWIGDPRVVPVAAWTYAPGIGYAVTDDGPLTIEGRFAGRPSATEREIAGVLRQMAAGTTLRGGRLLAQYGIRFVVVPLADGFNGTIDKPLAAPDGLVDVLDDQLDLASPLTRPPNFLVYENTAVSPTRSMLTEFGAEASKQAGGEAVAQSDLRGSTPFAVGSRTRGPAVGKADAGTLHVAVPFDDRWSLSVDGRRVPSRRAFGSTMAFDLPAGGTARLEYHTSPLRWLWVLLQAAASLALVVTAFGVRVARWIPRRRSAQLTDSSPIGDLSMSGGTADDVAAVSAVADDVDAAPAHDAPADGATEEASDPPRARRHDEPLPSVADDPAAGTDPMVDVTDGVAGLDVADSIDATDPAGVVDPFDDGDLDLEAVFADDLDEQAGGEPT